MTNPNGGTVWIYAQVYENEANLIKEGQLMEVTTDALPGQKFKGNVSSVGAYMTSETRSLLVRAEVSDPKGLLKPDMFVDTIVHIALGSKVAVPEEAVLDTGTRQLVFVNKDNGMYEPRKVSVGAHAEGYYEIIEGVSPGEEVVTSANFLIDSESRLKSAIK
ncbi:MAG: efflux RND transporter periplasmic adaptor subunit [Elusimicrobia bacterium]|nr:efflux RND transporter periplasmic adaptor subunit [Elusimicrobiota bacterium]